MKQREEAVNLKNSSTVLKPVTEEDAFEQLKQAEQEFVDENEEYEHSSENLINEANNIDTTTPLNQIQSNKRLNIISL
jgi:hypothetical protein